MDQDMSSNPVSQAPTVPVSPDGIAPSVPATNPAAAFAPEVPPAPVDTPAPDSPVVAPDPAISTAPIPSTNPEVQAEVVKKIAEAQNVLVALSGDPSVDEMAAAIGLSIFLDKLGKRATAIYSGSTPNALEFLKPEETFETTADTLQDFVIALNKDKADHLRYKLDGDYVKIFITPYKTRIGEEDLEFSYGDFNVDLVLALDVANGIDLDAALREHGRIMHDAVIINITTGNPGKFGEIEWSDKSASSVSEMIARLLYSINSKAKIEKEEATAFLTGIVAATNRFSNAKTTPGTMELASRLMESGANQQLISKNITPDVDNELYSLLGETHKRDTDPTKLDIEHSGEEGVDETKEVDAPITEETSTLLDDLKAAEASLATAGSETVPDLSNQPVKLDNVGADTAAVETELNSAPVDSIDTPALPTVEPLPSPAPAPEPASISEPSPVAEPVESPVLPESPEPISAPTLPPVMSSTESTSEPMSEEGGIIGSGDKPEKVIQPPADMDLGAPSDEGTEKYGKMLEDALSGLDGTSATTGDNPASMMAPRVASAPEINGVPEMNYMPMPGEEVLPPPPTPPIDMSTPMPEASAPESPSVSAEPITPIEPATPPVEPTPTSLGPQPAMQDQVYAPQVSDPGAFKIPGM